jgi:hypothetical protein
LQVIPKQNLGRGDCLIVRTRHSVYTIRVLGNNSVAVSGGWFDRLSPSPVTVRINGCSWGGSIIKIDIAAACGLCLEFSNRVITSPVEQILYLPSYIQN